MSKFAAIVMATGLIAAVPLQAEPRAAARPATGNTTDTMSGSSEAAVKREPRYCVVDTQTGTRIPRKTCHTRMEWLDRGFDPLVK